MIRSLNICNYALLKKVEINFNDGFTCISGETGAGKSIILDALSILLGKRTDRFLPSNNSKKSIIEGTFLLEDSHKSFFEQHDLDFEYETILRREISEKGKSRAFINDTPVLIQKLVLFGKEIIEVYEQNQNITLSTQQNQFQLIDKLSRSEGYLKDYQEKYIAFNQLKRDIEVIKSQGSLSTTEIDFLKFQHQEIDNASIIQGEKEDIESRINILQNTEGIANAIRESEELLNNDRGILDFLLIIKRRLVGFDNFSEIVKRLESVIIELQDINIEFSGINRSLDSDPEELIIINNRLDLINGLLQKHNLQFIEQLIDFRDDLQSRIELSSSFDTLLGEKKRFLDSRREELEESVMILNESRLDGVSKIKENIEEMLKRLDMPHARFDVEIVDGQEFHINGNTSILFKFSANKGVEMKELSKVASGGELSRLMLAIKYVLAKISKVHILVFDEIDAGVSGKVASLMGDMMNNISKSTQLIVISHLPQIASRAETHLKVVKNISKNETTSSVVELDKKGRVEELAKLLSGKRLTQAAINNAVDLLNQ